ncbi:MAG: hypothetical protein ACYC0V_06355 [Armatimonadota bacterium]
MKYRFCLSITAIIMMFFLSSAFSSPRYNVVDLGTMGGNESAAFRINNNGQIIGTSETADGFFHSVLWSSGRMIDLTPLIEADPKNWSNSKLYSLGVIGLNEAGMTSGTQRMEDGTMRAFLWNDSGLIGLGDFGGDSIAWDLNNSEQVVGTVTTPDGVKSFLWEKGSITEISAPYSGSIVAMAVNSIGQVTGNASVVRPHPTMQGLFENLTYAFIWDKGEMRELPSLGTPFGAGLDINDVGQIVGVTLAKKDNPPTPMHAALWDDEEVIDLGVLYEMADESSMACSINNYCQIVGVSIKEWVLTDSETGARRGINCGFYWDDDNGMLNLNDLIDQPGRWDIQGPADINDGGVIVGTGRYSENGVTWVENRAFMLIPVNETGEEIHQEPVQIFGVK